MPHVSKHVPDGKVVETIYKKLFVHLTEKGSASDRERIGAELFTPTERMMLAKRFAIICMLGEGYTFEDIQQTLRVSPSTVGRIWGAMQRGRYQKVVSIVRKREMIDFITSLFPRSRYAPRWKFMDDITFGPKKK